MLAGLATVLATGRVSDGGLLGTLEGETSWKGDVVFSPDGELLATAAGNNVVWLWRMLDGAVLHKLTGNVTSMAFSPDGGVLATNSADGTVWLWRVSDGPALSGAEGPVLSKAEG